MRLVYDGAMPVTVSLSRPPSQLAKLEVMLVLLVAACGAGRGKAPDPPPWKQPAEERAPLPPTRDPRGYAGRTPLHDAAQSGKLDEIRALLDGGADLEAVEEVYRYTPLLLALEYSEPEAALFLLERGASTAGHIGPQALLLAARSGDVTVIDALLARGIAPRGIGALHAAARYGHVSAIERLLAAGAQVDELLPDERWTPLLVACMENQPDAAKALLAAGASVEVRDRNGNTALHWAVFGSRPKEVHVYMELGGEHDTYFVPQTSAPILEMLLARRAPVDATDNEGRTPLHQAVLFEASSAVDALLTAGASRTARDREGKTPLELARARGHEGIARRLERP
ncbi:MAG TPA: ankyrin repeat domain-containing protein [Haliangium sp.]|nr:ankyrin repeat domain-containing protein [Haliangium sp.]